MKDLKMLFLSITTVFITFSVAAIICAVTYRLVKKILYKEPIKDVSNEYIPVSLIPHTEEEAKILDAEKIK